MHLTIFNGSPRGKRSNTKIILDHFLNGFVSSTGNTYELMYLKSKNNDFKKLFQEAECVLLAFPLYIDTVPAIVQAFIESLQPLCGRTKNPKIGFIVQSGYPESYQSRSLEKYLKKLAMRLKCPYLGTVIKGGVEPTIRIQPLMDTIPLKLLLKVGIATNIVGIGHLLDAEKLYKDFNKLGALFGKNEAFDRKIVLRMAKLERLNRFNFWVLKTLANHLFWNRMLKDNKALSKSYDKPYV